MHRTALLLLLLAIGLRAGESPILIGQRSDYTGVFPADCTPVTSWTEWELKEGMVKGKGGKPKKGLVVVGDKPVNRNIVWHTPMISSCNGQAIVVGGGLFVMRDRGGIHFSTGGHTPDFIGNQLVCLDPADGTVRWRQDLDHLDQLPAGEQEAARKDLAEHVRWWSAAFDAYADLHSMATAFNPKKGGHGSRREPGPPTEAEKAKFKTLAEAFNATGAKLPVDLDAAMKHELWPILSDKAYIQVVFWKLIPKAWPEQNDRMKRLQKWGYSKGRWQGQGSFCGQAMPTPASDGKRLYLATGNNDAFCVDLEGKRVWTRWFGPHVGGINAAHINSVYLLGDVMVVRYAGDIYGLKKETGETIWQHEMQWDGNNGNETTTPIRVPRGDGSTLDLVFEGTGLFLRAADGKPVGPTRFTQDRSFRPAVTSGEWFVVRNGTSAGGNAKPVDAIPKGSVVFRLKATADDSVELEQVCVIPDFIYKSGVIKEGLAWLVADAKSGMKVVDLQAGKVIFDTKGAKAGIPLSCHHVVSMAGGHLFWTDAGGGDWAVFTAERQPKQVAVNHFGQGGSSEYNAVNQGGQPFFSGNRMFYHAYEGVYCVGDPAQPMRLSAAHR